MADIARDHGVPGDGGLGGGVAEGEGSGGEVAEAGVKVEKLGDEEGVVAGASGDEEESVERASEAERGAGEEEAAEVHHRVGVASSMDRAGKRTVGAIQNRR